VISLDPSAGPLTINLEQGVIATDDGLIEIPDSVRKIVAKGGADANDAIHVVGSSADESARIRNAKLRFTGGDVSITASGYEVIDVYASGGFDDASVTGSRGDDRLTTSPLEAVLLSDGFEITFHEFDSVTATAGRGGQDEAVFYDSDGADLLVASSNQLELSGAGYRNVARGFTQTVAYSSGGFDRAIWEDRFAGSNLMVGNQYGALVGRNIAHELNGSWRVAVSSSNENVYLTDV